MGIRGVQFKKGKGCHRLDESFIPSTVFRGRDGCPLMRLKGQDHGFWREVSLGGEGPGILLPPLTLLLYRKGEGFDRLLNVNHGGVTPLLLLCLFALFLVLATVRVKSFLLNVPSSNF